MRGNDDFVRILRKALVDIEELKTAQPVGTNQIVAKGHQSAATYDRQFTVSAPFQSQGSSFKTLIITVAPQDLPPGNYLLSDLVADLKRTNGVRVSQWDANAQQINYGTYFFMERISNADDTQDRYFVGIVAPTGTVMRLKVYVMANTDVTFSIEELN